MDETYRIEFRSDHLHVEMLESYRPTPEMQDEIWERVRAACEENKTRRVLVEGILPESDRPPADVVRAGRKAAEIPNLWLAFNFDDFVPTETTELYEVIATSHGVRARFFKDATTALKWLRANALS
jgi:hypothetical protein